MVSCPHDESQVEAGRGAAGASGARFAVRAMVPSAAGDNTAIIVVCRIGPALMFERLWEETGCRAVELLSKRKHGFALERAVFLTVLHRLVLSSSDRAADRWREDYETASVDRARTASCLSGDGLVGRIGRHSERALHPRSDRSPSTKEPSYGAGEFGRRKFGNSLRVAALIGLRPLIEQLRIVNRICTGPKRAPRRRCAAPKEFR
jgi:hypothetical protein